jgi:hypothetical protein
MTGNIFFLVEQLHQGQHPRMVTEDLMLEQIG